MNLISSILTKNPCYTAGRKITVKGLMLHSIGTPQPSASVFVKNWNRIDFNSACVHGFIDGNTGDVYETLPWNHRGWHGGGSCNNTHIGVEMCEPSSIKYTSGANFIDNASANTKEVVLRTYQSAVELFAQLCREYNLNPLAPGVIVSHAEGYRLGIATNHSDPEHLWNKFGLSMDQFRQEVKNKMEEKDKTVTQEQWNQMYKNYLESLKNSPGSEWSKAGRQWCIEQKIIIGDDKGNYQWQAPLTREAMCVMLYRFNQALGKA
ncbi:MAG: peptidoglycan recognition protein family protein [Clostridia bacterium]|nr:peptidoglycan recognition protein family protein [Clostridia bacterium]